MNKQTSSDLSSFAGRVMSDARYGGLLRVRREEIIAALIKVRADAGDEARADAIIGVLQPLVDEIESLAASALSQDETPGRG